MSIERIGAIVASTLGIFSFFLPWISFNLLGVSFTYTAFEILEMAELFEIEHAEMYTYGTYIVIFLLVASLATSAFYEKIRPHVPHVKFVPLVCAIACLLVVVVNIVQIHGFEDELINITDLIGFGFYLFAISGFVLFVASIYLIKQFEPQSKSPFPGLQNSPMFAQNPQQNFVHYCANCSGELEADDVFCDNCGEKVAAAGGAIPSISTMPQTPSPIASIQSSSTPACTTCGSALEPGDMFCETCGQKVLVATVPNAAKIPHTSSPTVAAQGGYTPHAAASVQPPLAPQPLVRTRAAIPPHPSLAQPSAQGNHIRQMQTPLPMIPRMPLVFLLEASSASRAYIGELNAAINKFKADVCQNAQAASILDVAIVQFGDSADLLLYFAPVAKLNPVRFIAAGGANFSPAIQQAVQMVENRAYSQNESYKPWLVLISGSNPTDDIASVGGMVQSLQHSDRLRFLALSVGGHNLTALKQLTDVVFRLDDLDFGSFFRWLGGCMGAIAQTAPGVRPQLPPLQGNVYRDK